NARLGSRLTHADRRALGVRVIKVEREFNRKAGFTSEDDRLAQFFYEESLPPHNTVVVVSDEEMDSTFEF
ncbi:MAG: aldehyde ferredoxin oxidoreductase, partial [Desulfobacterales bacterium]